ncbi:MAG: hypothetical protein M3Z22_07990 [Verrucomicrobiota bacterium]|nr:hypothetical protein [Verrucomicrobiota bacterium]
MRIEQISNLDALVFVAAVLTVVWGVIRFVPGPPPPPRRRGYSEEEITAHDSALPKYFIAATLALFVGGLHTVLKNVPGAYVWLIEAGYGGHLVRDIANTHLVIVVGGTVAVTGLTWYALPRVARRPLASPTLAALSFWCTVVGATGFYVSNIVLGLVLGDMVRHGWDYQAAKDSIGAWYKVPIGVSSSIMGVGYWTFVANVFLTVRASRHIETPRPQAHLLKFFVIGALGLLIGTVQGVVQVLPAQARWIHATGEAGRYIDPIAHAHVNLVTGMLVLVAGIAFSVSHNPTSARRRSMENLVFWILAPGSLLFYATFMVLGWTAGHMMLNKGITFEQAVSQLGVYHWAPLMATGTLTLAGSWLLLGTLAHRFLLGPERTEPGAPLVAGAAVALGVGTLQGLAQLLPPVHDWLESTGYFGDSIVNVHAQLNMIGGVMLALLGLTFGRSRVLLGASFPRSRPRSILLLVGSGIGAYYLATLATGLTAGQSLRHGASLATAAARVTPLGPLAMMAAAALYAAGFGLCFRQTWVTTSAYRALARQNLRASFARFDGEPAAWRARVPSVYLLTAEALTAFAGFPGIGWIMSGRPIIGLPLALIGPGIAWAVVPLLASAPGSGPLVPFGMGPSLLGYLIVSSSVSVAMLARSLSRRSRQLQSMSRARFGER